MNWDNPTLKELTGILRDAFISFLMDIFVIKKAIKNTMGGGTSEDKYLREYEDEARWLEAMSGLKTRFIKEGKGKESQIATIDSFFANEASSREAKIFRFSVARIENPTERISALQDFCLADEQEKKARLRSLARNSGVIEWFEKKLSTSQKRWSEVLYKENDSFVEELDKFSRTLDPFAGFEFTRAICETEDYSERVARIQEILNLSPDDRLARAKARGLITNPISKYSNELGRILTDWLTNAQSKARAWRIRHHVGRTNAANDFWNSRSGRGIKWLINP